MKLKELINSFDHAGDITEDIEITGISCNSKEVEAGNLFVAIKGAKADAGVFAKNAVEKGAACVVTEKKLDIAVSQIIVRDSRSALARLSDRFFGKPSKKLKMVAVTGTNGKTTVTYLIESIFTQAGLNSGVIGTVNYRYGGRVFPAPLTTPSAPALQKLLKEMLDSGVTHCAMEVSSHSILQRRVEGTRFDVKVFTNLTPEHLDYHRTMEEYFRAKASLFTDAAFETGRAVSIINVDDRWGEILQKEVRPSLRYSLGKNADIYPVGYSVTKDGIEADIYTPRGTVSVASPLVGEHNLYNILASAGACCVLGLPLDAVGKGIAALKNVPGRLERVNGGGASGGAGGGIRAYVDYAHTPDALERTLTVISGISKGRVITVFGCGGNRDRLKRPVMGGISARLSDVTIVTSDNPREEDPLEIIKEIEKGMGGIKKYDGRAQGANKGYMIITDRSEAIKKAVEIAKAGDTILVAGKGHEDCQIVKGGKFAFDDREVLKNFLKEARPAAAESLSRQ